MSGTTNKKPKPVLENLDELFELDEKKEIGTPIQVESIKEPQEQANQIIDISFDLMDDFPGHPFHLYQGERRQDMIDSIKEKGILQPLILRDMENGRYCILSGHNRKCCGIEAGGNSAPSIIKRNISDDEALIYVIETNLMQRSFADMLHSEKAAVLAMEYSKLFSQGKRNDIKNELIALENRLNFKENSTSDEIHQKLNSRDVLADSYGMCSNTVARYLKIGTINSGLMKKLDQGQIPFTVAFILSYLKTVEQKQIEKCISLNEFKIDIKKANIIREYSEKGKLTEDNIYLILSGELGKTKQKRMPQVKIKPKVYEKYFGTNQTVKEVEQIVEAALELYFQQKEIEQDSGAHTHDKYNNDLDEDDEMEL